MQTTSNFLPYPPQLHIYATFPGLFSPCLPQDSPEPTEGQPHLLVEGGDEPQVDVDAGAALLGADELQDVVVLHPGQAVDLVLVLPRLLVLQTQQHNPSYPPGTRGTRGWP